MPNLHFETLHGRREGRVIAGVDEAGRGPLAGPVTAAALVIPADFPKKLAREIDDSKALTAEKREELFPRIVSLCPHAIACASVEEIDRINILQASLLAMRRAVESLQEILGNASLEGGSSLHCALIDGNKAPRLSCKTETVIRGDGISLSIAAASILAKVTRDRLMTELHGEFPHYGWARNAGYPTPLHLEALKIFGPSPHHRQSFAPVRNCRAA